MWGRAPIVRSLLLLLFSAWFWCIGAAGSFAQSQTAGADLESRIEKLIGDSNFDQALPLIEEMLRIAEAQQGNDDAVAAALLIQSEVLEGLGRYKEAEAAARRSLELLERLSGRDSADVAAAANRIAIVLWQEGQYLEAEKFYKRALDIRVTTLGADHVTVGHTSNGLGLVYMDLGRYPEAERLFLRAIELRKKGLGPHHTDVAQSTSNLASLHFERGRYAEAEQLYKEAIAIDQKALGADHTNVAVNTNNLAVLYLVEGRYAEAETLSKRVLAIYQKNHGAEHHNVAYALNNLASIQAAQGRLAEAEPGYQRVLAIRKKVLGDEHPEVAETLDNLATVLSRQGRYGEAEPLFRNALELRKKALGPEHPTVAESLSNMAGLYQRQSKAADAEPLYVNAQEISEKALGPEHSRVADILCNFGAFLKSERRLDEARARLERAVAVSEKALGAEHPQTVRCTVQLAELYGLLGRATEAEKLFDKAKAAKSVDMKEFAVYFGTNRKPDADAKRRGSFGTEEGDELLVGMVRVIVPPSTGIGGKPGQKETDRPVAGQRQLTIRAADTLDRGAVVRTARDRLTGARKFLGRALVFVHGFNTSFDSAVRRAAQLAYDLEFDGPVFMFSWPSREKVLAYLADRDTALESSEMLRAFLETVVAETGANAVHVIAHSVGNYALNEAIRSMDEAALRRLKLAELVLASPDLDIDRFQRTLRRLIANGTTSTVYAASSDLALTAASLLGDRKPQLGYIPRGGPERLPAGADFIDITLVSSEIFSLNHDVYANSPELVADLGRILLLKQRPPDTRSPNLEKISKAGESYWRYKR